MITLSNKDADFIANFAREMISERLSAIENIDSLIEDSETEDDRNYLNNLKQEIQENPQTQAYDKILQRIIELMMCGSDDKDIENEKR